jgi:transposase-like protein
MSRMLPEIDTLAQHQHQLAVDPGAYRPERCPGCHKAGLHGHGCYARKAPRGGGLAYTLGPLLIPRFHCPSCGRTCSRLPACLAPRRQYWWASQQAVLAPVLAGLSLRAAAKAAGLSRHTAGRWRTWLAERYAPYALVLRSRFADLGRADGWRAFWAHCLATLGLGPAMGWLDRSGVRVP